MKSIFDELSRKCSKLTTLKYSTSFSLGIYFLSRELRDPIYGIYGFVRFADEIVDSFHGYDKAGLLKKFRQDTFQAIDDKISLNPILHSFQQVVHNYDIEWELIDTFLKSMEMDLECTYYDTPTYEKYILGSAEVVGLMCLKVFTSGDNDQYEKLKYPAMKLGAAFQKVNFLRDIQADYFQLGRIYFPGVNLETFTMEQKKIIEEQIEEDFREALVGMKALPSGARKGVYLAYSYYLMLFRKIQNLPAERILTQRISVRNSKKMEVMFTTMLKHQLNLL